MAVSSVLQDRKDIPESCSLALLDLLPTVECCSPRKAMELMRTGRDGKLQHSCHPFFFSQDRVVVWFSLPGVRKFWNFLGFVYTYIALLVSCTAGVASLVLFASHRTATQIEIAMQRYTYRLDAETKGPTCFRNTWARYCGARAKRGRYFRARGFLKHVGPLVEVSSLFRVQ